MPQTNLRLRLLCTFSALALLFAVVRADEKACTTHDNGNYYDLNGLKASKDYEFTSSTGATYILNLCKRISHETWAIKVDKPEDVAGFTRRAHGDFSMGDVNTTVLFREGNPVVLMTDGSPCPNGGNLTASTAIRFICDSSVGTGQPKMIATLPPDEENACSFFVEWRTEVACPMSQSVWGTIFLTFFIMAGVLVLLYMAGGLLNRYVLRPRGMDVSFFSFWDILASIGDCIGRVKDMSSDAWHSRNWGGGSSGGHGYGYSGLRGAPEEAETMLGGPPGFLDESDEEDESPRPQENPPPSGMDLNGVIRV